jgi:SAM-dependent methyltransferase
VLNKVFRKLQTEGFRRTSAYAYKRVARPACRSFKSTKHLLTDRQGIEIGGPSRIFSPGGAFPVYRMVAGLDNCNFHNETIWEGDISEGNTFHFSPSHPPGRQFIGEAWNLAQLADSSVDFVLSSHMIEHTANPIRTIKEWIRVVKSGGVLVVVFPLKTGAFDHRRPTTHLEHLIEDFRAQTDEGDLSHLPEILKLHDLQRDPEAGTIQQFVARSRDNARNRCLHHHVFDDRSVGDLFTYLNLEQLAIEVVEPVDIVAVVRKP